MCYVYGMDFLYIKPDCTYSNHFTYKGHDSVFKPVDIKGLRKEYFEMA